MSDQTSPRNTTADAKQHPEVMLVDMAFGGGVEAQEKRGQQELLQATTLPTDVSNKEKFLELGFKFGQPLEEDRLFCEATLPEGWTREGTEHSMWTTINDERGIPRVAIFYKAAFYDRAAFMRLENVGKKLTSLFIYSDKPAEPDLSKAYTADELSDALVEAEGYIRKGEESEHYADLVPRATIMRDALLKRIG